MVVDVQVREPQTDQLQEFLCFHQFSKGVIILQGGNASKNDYHVVRIEQLPVEFIKAGTHIYLGLVDSEVKKTTFTISGTMFESDPMEWTLHGSFERQGKDIVLTYTLTGYKQRPPQDYGIVLTDSELENLVELFSGCFGVY